MGQNHSWAMQTTGLSIQEASRSCNHQQRLFYKVLNKVFNTYSLCHFTLFIMTQLVYLNVLISLYEFNIWLDGYIWWKFCVNSPLRNPLTDKNADVSNTYFPRCIVVFCLHNSDSTEHWVRPQYLALWINVLLLPSKLCFLLHICHFIPSLLYTLVFCDSWNINEGTMYFIHVLVAENKQIFHNRCGSVNKRKFAPWTRYRQFR